MESLLQNALEGVEFTINISKKESDNGDGVSLKEEVPEVNMGTVATVATVATAGTEETASAGQDEGAKVDREAELAVARWQERRGRGRKRSSREE